MGSRHALFLSLILAIPAAAQAPRPPAAKGPVSPSAESVLTSSGFSRPADIRFDESMGTERPTPHIPKAWRFVGVSNGAKQNSNNLWFQDPSGNIYLIQGFNTAERYSATSKFVISEFTQVLRVE